MSTPPGPRRSPARYEAESQKAPEAASASEARSRTSSSLVRAGSLAQLALLLPAATLVGWAIGLGLDQWLGQHWIYIAGLLVGAGAGFVQVFRVVLTLNKE